MDTTNKTVIGNCVKNIYDAMRKASDELRKIYQIEDDAVTKIKSSSYLAQYYDQLDFFDLEKEKKDLIRSYVDTKALFEIKDKAFDILNTAFKENGLLTQNQKFQMTELGEGKVGKVFKCKFQDTNGQTLFTDKTFKVFKPDVNDFDKHIGKSNAVREMNAGAYVNNNVGHQLKKTNIVPVYCSNIRDRYLLSEFSSLDNLGKVRKMVNIDSIGIMHSDLDDIKDVFNKPTGEIPNVVAGRIIDYGGFVTKNEVLATNKVARRYYKKIGNIQNPEDKVKYWNEVNKLVQENKIPNKGDVYKGLIEAVQLIPENYRSQLNL